MRKRIFVWRCYKTWRIGATRVSWLAYYAYSEMAALDWCEEYGGRNWFIKKVSVLIHRRQLERLFE